MHRPLKILVVNPNCSLEMTHGIEQAVKEMELPPVSYHGSLLRDSMLSGSDLYWQREKAVLPLDKDIDCCPR